MEMTLTTAVVGAGTVSDVHCTGLTACPRTDLVAVVDRDGAAARAAARRHDVAPFTDLEDAIETCDPDWLHVCTPVASHRPIAETALAAGVPVLIEKPVAETVGDVEAIASAAAAAGQPASVVHNNRFSPAVRRARALIDAGELGPIRGVDLLYTGSTAPDVENRGAWSFELAGGEFEEGLPHPLYTLLSVGGYPRDEGSIAARTALAREYDMDFEYDGASVQYVTGDERLCTATVLSGTVPHRSLYVHGEDGSLVVDLISGSVVRFDRDYKASPAARALKNVDEIVDRSRSTLRNLVAVARRELRGDWESRKALNGHYYQYDETAAAIQNDAPMPVPLSEGRWTIELQAAIRRAAAQAAEPNLVSDE